MKEKPISLEDLKQAMTDAAEGNETLRSTQLQSLTVYVATSIQLANSTIEQMTKQQRLASMIVGRVFNLERLVAEHMGITREELEAALNLRLDLDKIDLPGHHRPHHPPKEG